MGGKLVVIVRKVDIQLTHVFGSMVFPFTSKRDRVPQSTTLPPMIMRMRPPHKKKNLNRFPISL